jgi:hypothetical protein
MRPCARGPGASAIGGAGVGDGEREVGSIAPGMMGYECWEYARQYKVCSYKGGTHSACSAHCLCLLTDALKLARASALYRVNPTSLDLILQRR